MKIRCEIPLNFEEKNSKFRLIGHGHHLRFKKLYLETIYGILEVQDPLAQELISSAPFQRLKGINQYGVVNYIVPTEKYSRYDHSIGVYYLLKAAKRSRDEQIAGLLHDASHTVFSHVGDYVFEDQCLGNSYQDQIHLWYLRESGLEAILTNHKFSLESINHKNPAFIALDQPLPNLCADRIEYNLQGGLLRGLLTKEEFTRIHQGLSFNENRWILTSLDDAKKLGACSLIMTETLWGAAWEAISYRLTAEALRRSFAISLISFEEFHFSTDDKIWNTLFHSNDSYIKECMEKIRNIHSIYSLTEYGKEEQLIKLKFRGVNPLVATSKGTFPLTWVDPSYQQEFERVKSVMEKGWAIKFNKNFNSIEYKICSI